MHEASLWPQNCFVTLTYAPGNLPAGASLEHRDFQLFMKRVRKSVSGRSVRFYMCGEYGPKELRPHFHACLFNIDFSDRVPAGKSSSGSIFYSSVSLSTLWGLGKCSVQDLTNETASYCSRYIMKKALGDTAAFANDRVDEDGVIYQVKPEYAAMSLKPGIGAGWFAKFHRDVFPHDFVISKGSKRNPPKYYDVLLKRHGSEALDAIEFARYQRGLLTAADSTDARLAAREEVHLARVQSLKRGIE